jgi:hypothetical protein
VFEQMDQITCNLNSDVDQESLKRAYSLGVQMTEFKNVLKEYGLCLPTTNNNGIQ